MVCGKHPCTLGGACGSFLWHKMLACHVFECVVTFFSPGEPHVGSGGVVCHLSTILFLLFFFYPTLKKKLVHFVVDISTLVLIHLDSNFYYCLFVKVLFAFNLILKFLFFIYNFLNVVIL
jgi:hypothetical protein